MSTVNDQTVEARHRILFAAGAALLAAGLILVMFVLPAEYAVDPLGTGARVGAAKLSIGSFGRGSRLRSGLMSVIGGVSRSGVALATSAIWSAPVSGRCAECKVM